MRQWTEDHGEPGLRDKFAVYKPRDGSATEKYGVEGWTVYEDMDRIGADGEFVFVLRPETDQCAYLALREYATWVLGRDPKLWQDITGRLDAIRDRQKLAS